MTTRVQYTQYITPKKTMSKFREGLIMGFSMLALFLVGAAIYG